MALGSTGSSGGGGGDQQRSPAPAPAPFVYQTACVLGGLHWRVLLLLMVPTGGVQDAGRSIVGLFALPGLPVGKQKDALVVSLGHGIRLHKGGGGPNVCHKHSRGIACVYLLMLLTGCACIDFSIDFSIDCAAHSGIWQAFVFCRVTGTQRLKRDSKLRMGTRHCLCVA